MAMTNEKSIDSLEEFLVSLDDFKMEKLIGKGGFSEVWLATHKKTQDKCAIKKLYLKNLEGKDLEAFFREAQILASCHDFFLLPFHGFTKTYPYSIITEFIPNGSLYDALRHKPGSPKLNASHKTLIAIGIAHGMMELHKKGVIHRDLKSLNVLLDDRILPRICDFGISRFADQDEETTKEVGSPHWMAPEIFETDHYTEKVDVYAYGMILWEMLTEQQPFKGKTNIQVAIGVCANDERPKIPASCPVSLKNLIQTCWQKDPEKRPTFQQIYQTFYEKKTMYRDTDQRLVNAIFMLIKNEESKILKDPLHHLFSRRLNQLERKPITEVTTEKEIPEDTN